MKNMIKFTFIANLLFIFSTIAQPLIDFTSVTLRGNEWADEVDEVHFDMFLVQMDQNWRCSTDSNKPFMKASTSFRFVKL